MAALVDLFWPVNAPVDGKYYSAVWHLPEGRPGYVVVFKPYEGKFNPSAGRVSLGRWKEDDATKDAFGLARQGGAKQVATKEASVFHTRNYVFSSGSRQQTVYFGAEGKTLLDRATLLISRGVVGDGLSSKIDSQTKGDTPIDPGPSEQDKAKGGGSWGAGEVKKVAGGLPQWVKVGALGALGAAVGWVAFKR